MLKLNVGCGDRKIPGFVNIDIRSDVHPDIVDDISKLTKIETNTVDVLYASHVLEHMKRTETLSVLGRWFEVLKPGGLIRLAVPSFASVVHMYEQGCSLKNLIGFLYGGQNYEYNFHYYCWDFFSLREDLEKVGFVNIRHYDWRKTEHASIDDYSQSYLPHMDKEKGYLMSLNVEADKK